MYIFGYLHPPHTHTQSEQQKESICLQLHLQKVLTEGSKQKEQLHSRAAGGAGLGPVSEALDRFWLRIWQGWEDRAKGIHCVPQSTGFWSSFPPNFPGPLQMLTSLMFRHLSYQGHWSLGRDATKKKTLQTHDVLNSWFTKFKYLNFKNSHLFIFFICGTLSYLCNRAEVIIFPSCGPIPSPTPKWTSTASRLARAPWSPGPYQTPFVLL